MTQNIATLPMAYGGAERAKLRVEGNCKVEGRSRRIALRPTASGRPQQR